jgi:hypothetical protein
MSRYTKGLVLFVVIFGVFVLLPTFASACGGFFCTTTPIDQSAERIIFTVNGDGTITAIVGINYTGAAEDFSWVVPVPSPPVLDVAEAASLNVLELATAVQVNNPPRYCSGIFPQPCCFGGGGGGGYLAQGDVGPYDYAIIRNEDPDEMVRWLRDNGYRITPEMEPLVEVYVEEGMYFLAMKLNEASEVGDIQPVVMTYESTKPMIPIRLTAVAAVPDMPIITWIFADTRYVPENYAHPRPNFSAFRAPGEITADSFGNLFFSSGNGLYQAERARIQDRFDGLAFITEYAGPTENLRELTQDDALFEQLIDEFPYLTRLRAQMSPEQMTIDPMFIPAPNAPDVSNIVNLADYVDPLEYWGCSSRTALNSDDGPAVRLTRVGHRFSSDEGDLDTFQNAADWVVDQFGLSEDDALNYVGAGINCDPATFTPPIRFVKDGRMGYVRFMSDYIVSASSLEEDFAQYDDTFMAILNGIEFVDCG